MSQEKLTLNMTEAQWRQLILERLMELEAFARANHVLTTQAIHYITKADPRKLDKAAEEMVKSLRADVEKSVAANAMLIISESSGG